MDSSKLTTGDLTALLSAFNSNIKVYLNTAGELQFGDVKVRLHQEPERRLWVRRFKVYLEERGFEFLKFPQFEAFVERYRPILEDPYEYSAIYPYIIKHLTQGKMRWLTYASTEEEAKTLRLALAPFAIEGAEFEPCSAQGHQINDGEDWTPLKEGKATKGGLGATTGAPRGAQATLKTKYTLPGTMKPADVELAMFFVNAAIKRGSKATHQTIANFAKENLPAIAKLRDEKDYDASALFQRLAVFEATAAPESKSFFEARVQRHADVLKMLNEWGLSEAKWSYLSQYALQHAERLAKYVGKALTATEYQAVRQGVIDDLTRNEPDSIV